MTEKSGPIELRWWRLMNQFRNKHKNERAFIVANGPSLNDIDVTKLDKEIVFALNRGYLKDDLSIDYLVVVNDLVEKQFGSEILKVPCKAVFSNGLPNTNRLLWTGDSASFQTDITRPMWQGHTVTFVALQVAFYMGCNPVYIVGLDHYYDYSTSSRKGGRGIISEGNDPNHFHPDYFGKDVRWDPANLRMSEIAYKLARQEYNKHGRELYNASFNTALDESVIPRVDFDSLWQ